MTILRAGTWVSAKSSTVSIQPGGDRGPGPDHEPEGAPTEVMLPIVETIDFRNLGRFGL